VKSPTGNIHTVRAFGSVKRTKLAPKLSHVPGIDAPNLALPPQPFQRLVSEAFDHQHRGELNRTIE
jgi:hypothetical protein